MHTAEPCYHCGLPSDVLFAASVQGIARSFCCIGCQAVALAISESGLADFYRFRESESRKADEPASDFSLYDRGDAQRDFVRPLDERRAQARLFISGITCAACIWLIEKSMESLPGVEQVRVNASNQQAIISFVPDIVPVSRIFERLTAIGFAPQPLVAQAQRDRWALERRQDLIRLGVAGIGMMQAGMVSIGLHAGDIQGMDAEFRNLLRWVCLVLTAPVIFYSAQPFFRAAWNSLRARHLIMDVPVSVALILAFSASVYATVSQRGDVYFDSVAMFTFFLLLGRYIEKRIRHQNYLAAAGRAQLLPSLTQRINDDGSVSTVPLKDIQLEDRLMVAAGAVFPCDGRIIEGRSEADESLITGESMPRAKGPGDGVIAGSYNGGSPVRIVATAVAENTQIAAIERLIEQSELARPSQVALADRIARRFSPAILSLALAVFAYWSVHDPERALWITLSVLVVTCPCALGLATPTVTAAANLLLRHHGLLMTGPQALETLARVNGIVFDKTGTLTQGAFRIQAVQPLGTRPEEEILAIAAALEEGSSHPLARAFRHISPMRNLTDRHAFPGEGVVGKVGEVTYRLGTPAFAVPQQPPAYPDAGLWLLLAADERPIGWIALADQLRPEASECVAALQQRGGKVSLLSGDRVENVSAVATTLGIRHWQASMLPADKVAEVRRYQAEGDVILMVGDGINDVPVLSAANVSLAMGSASELAQTRADCVLLNEDLRQVPLLLAVARRVRAIIAQNLGWAIAYNLVALPFAVAGWVPPWLAAVGMSASSLVVVINARRIQFFKG